jgi:Niemann-Pick C1 protein
LALIAVLVVLLLFTGNVTVSMMVLFCVGLVDLFLFGLLTFWKVTLNSVTIINVVIAIGLAVDYSAHIGHAYLTIDPPSVDE